MPEGVTLNFHSFANCVGIHYPLSYLEIIQPLPPQVFLLDEA